MLHFESYYILRLFVKTSFLEVLPGSVLQFDLMLFDWFKQAHLGN